MSKPEWTKIGNVEVCVGTDGVTGVWNDDYVAVVFGSGRYATAYSKEEFEAKYCQPPKPKHRLIESADGSVCVVSTEEVDGKPVRMAMVKVNCNGRWSAEWKENHAGGFLLSQAIDRAVRYVETGE